MASARSGTRSATTTEAPSPPTTEDIRLIRFAPGTALPAHDHPAGEEVFVLEGTYTDADGSYGPGTWVRYPPGSRHAPSSA